MEANSSKYNINISTITILKIVVTVLLLAVLYIIRDLLLILLVSIVLASAMDPFVDWLYKKAKFPRGLSVILVYLLFVAVVGTVVYFLIPAITSQFEDLSGRFVELRMQLLDQSTGFARAINTLGISDKLASFKLSSLGDNIGSLSGGVLETTLGVFSGIVQVLAVLAITFYLISSENGMKNFIKSLVPFKHQAYAVHLTSRIQRKIGFWLLGQVLLSLFIFALTFIGLTLLGVKFALALALLAGLLEIVPYLGPTLSAIPAIFVAFVQSPPLALLVLLLYIVVQQVENYVLVPKVMGKSVGANPLIILFAVLVGFQIAGILGILLSVPVVAAINEFLKDFWDVRAGQESNETT